MLTFILLLRYGDTVHTLLRPRGLPNHTYDVDALFANSVKYNTPDYSEPKKLCIALITVNRYAHFMLRIPSFQVWANTCIEFVLIIT